MRRTRIVTLAALLLAAGNAAPAGVVVHALSFPERSPIDVPFVATASAPAGATLGALVTVEGARARIEMSWKKMMPAILFGGDVTCYVAWVVTTDGAWENLGELFVKDAIGGATYSTGRKTFGMMVTAEPFPGVDQPNDVVVFTSGATLPKAAKSEAFAFGAFAPEAKPANLSIGAMEWKGREPLELAQARAICTLAERVGAGNVNARAMQEAKVALAQAENSSKGGSGSSVAEYGRRASSLASEALRDAYRKRAADEAARVEAERIAKEAEAAARVTSSENALAELEALRQKTELDLQQTKQAAAALAATRAQLEADETALRAERDAVAARLGRALDEVAPTTRTDRGLVVSLPGTSFDAGKATLRPDARVTLGKLAGILLMVPEVNVRIEGYTDSSGRAESNLKLSTERARSVFGLLSDQGIADTRMVFEGYGSENPIAPNDTTEGKAMNRRVEIIVAEGRIQAAPRAAPEAAPGTPAARPAAAPKK